MTHRLYRNALLGLPLAALALAGCNQAAGTMGPAPRVTQASAPAPDTAGQVATAVAAKLNTQVGQAIEGGVQVLGAQAEGPNVVADFGVPIAGAGLTEDERAEVGPLFTDALRSGFCADDTAQTFFDLGNTLRVRFQGSDGVDLADVSLNSCSG
ncbi:hypothetical protein [Roseisalinus antarcticus]|uniref:Lipoprotein n=1 Tax=Roseisalinus antarcticus TaxID=254357 RepID=A0A1Y5S1Z4_9RHOB|nr:hypothetical protein [Roseisalinus antarcticus]SLN27840.1 hypothetical protein ROA7023_00909 [Roseisalinus antarcticus]